MPRIYTKTGDDGTTGLLYGGRVSKADLVPEACGTLDEAVAVLGLARAHAADPALSDELLGLQRELFVVGADLATNPDQRAKLEPGVSLVSPEMVARLESRIDELVAAHPLPNAFIVPGANPVSAFLDLARSTIRRAERRVVELRESGRRGQRGRVPLPEPALGRVVRPRARRGGRDGADQPDRGTRLGGPDERAEVVGAEQQDQQPDVVDGDAVELHVERRLLPRRHRCAVHDLDVDLVAVDRVLDVEAGGSRSCSESFSTASVPLLPSRSSVTNRPSFAYS